MRDGWLQGIEAVIERKQRVPPERHNRCLFGLGQNGGTRLLRPGLEILDRLSPAPLRHRLLVYAQFPAQRRERSLRSFGHALEPVAGKPSLLQL